MAKMSVILLGDSIFDNQVYVPGEPCVHDHLQRELGEPVTLLAVDGAVTRDVLSDQIDRIPGSATHLVLSVGGNDAIQAFYDDLTPEALQQSALAFEVRYAELIEALQATGLPLCACTIYCDCPLDADLILSYAMRHYLPWYNEAIVSVLERYDVPLIDLREICTEPEDYSARSPIEPSNQGGYKIAMAIGRSLTIAIRDCLGDG